jgi:2,5-diketo-D-gluconate reductase A
MPRYKSVLADVGKKYDKTAAQVGLRWIVQNGGSYCVQSKKESHFGEDINVFDFELSSKDMDLLSGLQPPVSLG